METMGPFANFDFPSTVDEMNYSFLSNGFDEYYLDLETSQEPHQQQPQSRANSNENSQNQSYTQQQDQPAYYSNHSFQHTLPVADAFVPGASTCDQMLVEHYDMMGTGYRAFQDAEILSFDDMLNTANGAPFNANYAQPVCPPSPISSSATESTDQETTDVDASTASQKQKACTLPLKAKTTPASAVPVMQGKKLPHLHQQSAQEQLRQPQAQRQAPLLQNDSQSKSRRQQTPPQPLQVSTAMPTPSMDSPILPQADMPNLNLGDNLVSSIDFQVSTPLTSPSSGNSPPESASNVAPMTPAEIMKLSKTRQAPAESSKEQQKSFQLQQQPRKSEQEPRSKQKKQQRVATNPPGTKHQNLNAQLVVRQGTNNAGSQQVIVISPVVSPCKGIVNGVASSRRKGTMPTSVSPLGLGPSSRSSPGLQPLISPSLKPKGIAGGAAEQLAQKSNYQNILEGNAQAMGITYSSDLQSSLESRRTTHKAAEQKRRDSLKQSFDDLKKVVPGKLSQSGGNSDNGVEANGRVGTAHGNDEKNMSKLILLKRARDHIVELQQEVKDKDETIKRLTEELEALRGPKRMKCSHARKLEPVKEDDEEMSKKVHV